MISCVCCEQPIKRISDINIAAKTFSIGITPSNYAVNLYRAVYLFYASPVYHKSVERAKCLRFPIEIAKQTEKLPVISEKTIATFCGERRIARMSEAPQKIKPIEKRPSNASEKTIARFSGECRLALGFRRNIRGSSN